MSIIKVMSKDLASKIAAGEVVENQASIVKELVENSIDAKASKIEIVLIDCGLQLIQVTDNGIGMDQEDLLLCTKPHASSKLTSEYDLFNIKTLGFRGEALASIASVARVKIMSNNNQGNGLILDASDTMSISEGYLNQGTSIACYNIFYNVPARLKYLKSNTVELANVLDLVTKLALSYPAIAFSLKNNDKVLLETNGRNNPIEIIRNIYSLEIAKNLEKISFEDDDFKVTGYISNSTVTKGNRKHINIFLNQRLITNQELLYSIIDGYDDYLMERRFPISLIEIQCDNKLIDVNVHPAKLEVRISKVEQLTNLITNNIREYFNIKAFQFIVKEKVIQPTLEFTYNEGIKSNQDVIKEVCYNEEIIKEDNRVNEDVLFDLTIPLKEEVYLSKEDSIKESDHIINQQLPQQELVYINFNVIGQFNGTYILAQNEDGLHLIDQHAAMERINYEKLKEDLTNTKYYQLDLLTPIIIELNLQERLKLKEFNQVFKDLHLVYEVQVNNDIVFRKIPSWVDHSKAYEYLENIINYLIELRKIKPIDIKKEDIIMASCKMSLKANNYLNHDEQVHLIERLIRTSNYNHCPHGRPIIVSLSVTDVEKLFKRVL